MNKMILVILVVVSMLLTGCAAMIAPDHQNVRINSIPTGANVRVFDGHTIVFQDITPTIFRVPREHLKGGRNTRKNYSITITMNGYESAEYTLSRRISGANKTDWAIGLATFGAGALMGGFNYDDTYPRVNENDEETGMLLLWAGGLYCALSLFSSFPEGSFRRQIWSYGPSSINARLNPIPGYFDGDIDFFR
jgi:hypothetical protein